MKKQQKILLLSDSDFGDQIGKRTYYVADKLLKSKFDKNNLIIFSRSNNKKKLFNIYTLFPFGKLIMQILTAIPIYIYKKFPANEIKNYLFDHFILFKLKRINIEEIGVVHSWCFLPKTYTYLKQKNSSIKIIQDVPIAFNNIFKKIENYEEIFIDEKPNLEKYIFKAMPLINYFIVPSSFVKDSLSKEKINKKIIIIIPFGVNIKQFKPIPNKVCVGKFKVAFSGNVNNRKGIKYLIKAWKDLNLKNAELNIYGRIYPETKQYLIDKKKFNINTFGFMDLTEELPKNSIYVFPSLMEGSAKSVYEAMACGLPIITTYNAGSVIQNGKEGFIIPVQDVTSIKEKILFFYNNRNEIEKFGKQARKTAEKYTWERYAKKIIKMYF